MSDVPLPPIRIGFPYTVEVDFPAGFLDAGEAVRTRFRRFVDDTPVVPTDTLVGDAVTWELTPEQTATMAPGTYFAEAELYLVADPTAPGTLLTDNRYVVRCDHSVSEPAA